MALSARDRMRRSRDKRGLPETVVVRKVRRLLLAFKTLKWLIVEGNSRIDSAPKLGRGYPSQASRSRSILLPKQGGGLLPTVPCQPRENP